MKKNSKKREVLIEVVSREEKMEREEVLKRLAKKVGCPVLKDKEYAIMAISPTGEKGYDFIKLMFKVCEFMEKKSKILG